MTTTPWTGDPLQNPAMAPPAPQAVNVPAGGRLGGVSAVLQGLQQGYAKRQSQLWDQMQRSYMAAKAQADAAKQYRASLQAGDPHIAAADENLKAATDHLATQTQALTNFAQGINSGKGGAGGAGKKAGATGSQVGQSALGKVLSKATNVLLGVHAPQTTPTAQSPVPPAPDISGGGTPGMTF